MPTTWRRSWRRRPADLRGSVIGVGSNLLVRDGGIPGVVVRLPAAFGKIEVRWHAHARGRRGAGRRGGARRRRCRHRRPGIPARRAGHDRRRAEDECRLLWPRDQGHFRRSHRHRRQGQQHHAFAPPTWASSIARRRCRDDLIFVEAVFEGTPDEPDAIRARMEELVANREASQPIKRQDRRLDLQESARPQGLAVDRRRRLPRPDDRRRAGEREALQLPHQHRRRHRRRHRGPGRRSPRAGARKSPASPWNGKSSAWCRRRVRHDGVQAHRGPDGRPFRRTRSLAVVRARA